MLRERNNIKKPRRNAECRRKPRIPLFPRASAALRGLPRFLFLFAFVRTSVATAQEPPERIDRGRFSAVFFSSERRLAQSLIASAAARDTYPGLPRPRAKVLLMLAPDNARFREWVGPGAPEWGSAIAFPESNRIVMQGKRAASDAGDPEVVFRHELAHLALHEQLGDRPPRWFDEGYASFAAGEWGREELLAANVGLLIGGTPSLSELEKGFHGGPARAEASYALAHRAVVELSELDRERGLALFFQYWKSTNSLDRSVRSAYGMTLSAFETRWRQRTISRYGGLALFANFTLASIAGLIILGPLYWSRRRRMKRKMAEMLVVDAAQEKAAEEAARQSALDQL